MREAFLSGPTDGQPVFSRTKPLSKPEILLLEQAQEPEYKVRYSYHDCQVHGIFAVDGEQGLSEITCPRRGKCTTREVFDPTGYLEHYKQTDPNKLTPAQELQLDQVLALSEQPGQSDEQLRAQMEQILGCKVKTSAAEMLATLRQGLGLVNPTPPPVPEAGHVGDGLGFPPSELKRRLERVLGVAITATPEEIAQGFREGLAFIDYNKEPRPEPDEEPEEPAEPPLTEIEHYASLQFTRAEVCTIVGLDLATEGNTPEFNQQYERGQLIQTARLRATIFLHANNGSAPAQTEALKLMRYANAAKAGGYDE